MEKNKNEKSKYITSKELEDQTQIIISAVDAIVNKRLAESEQRLEKKIDKTGQRLEKKIDEVRKLITTA